MKKVKNIVVGIIAAVIVVSCVAVPTSAEDFYLSKGQQSVVTTIMGAPGVVIHCESDGFVVCSLRYPSGSSMVTAWSRSLRAGETLHYSVTGYPPTTIWQFVVSSLSGYYTAWGYIEPYYGT